MKKLLMILAFLACASVRAEAAIFVAGGNINLSGNWLTTDAAGNNVVSPVGQIGVGTGNIDSSTFVLGNSQVEGFAIWIASRVTSPTGTLTGILRNSTTSTDQCTVTANISDFVGGGSNTTAEHNGGWHHMKCPTAFTPNGTDSYILRFTSSVTNEITVFGDGVGNNTIRLVVRTATGTPGAGDDMYVQGLLDGATNPATASTVTVTNDNTATTTFGNGSTNTNIPALAISYNGIFAYGTAGSTNYYLKLDGWLDIWPGGKMTIGEAGVAEIPRTSTAVLELVEASDAAHGIHVLNTATFKTGGLSRTSGKDVVWTLLTANLAASGTSATVADDTGWLSGDVVGIATTDRTNTHIERVTLNTNAGASSLAWTGGVTYLHEGSTTDKVQAEVVLLTRNVIVRSSSSTNMMISRFGELSIVDLSWTAFRYCGYDRNNTQSCWGTKTTTGGTFTAEYDSVYDAACSILYRDDGANVLGTGVWNVQHLVMFNADIKGNQCETVMLNGTLSGTFTMNDIVLVHGGNGQFSDGIWYMVGVGNHPGLTLTNIRSCCGTRNGGVYIGNGADTTDYTGINLGPFVVHSQTSVGVGLYIAGGNNITINGLTAWRNEYGYVNQTQQRNLVIHDALLFGNAQAGVAFGANLADVFFTNFKAYGDTSYPQPYGLRMDGNGTNSVYAEGLRFDGCDFGTSNGSLYTTHSGADVAWAFAHTKIVFNNCLFASTTKVSGTLYALDEIAYQNYQRTAGLNRTDYAHGTVAQESTTVHSPATTSEKLTPTSALRKLTTGVRYTSVNNTHSANVCAWVQKDGSYNGNAPRLMQKANPAVGISADAVLATATLTSASTWYQVCGTTATFSDNGVATTFVDVDGTAGNIFVSDWVASIN